MKKCYTNFHIFIPRLLKLYSPINITLEAKDIINQLIHYLIIKYIQASINLTLYAGQTIINGNSILTLTNIWIKPNLHIIIDTCKDTWLKYINNTEKGLKKHTKAELCLPPARIKEYFHKYYKSKISEKAIIYLTSIIEQIIINILIQSTKNAKEQCIKHINGQHIYNSIHNIDLFNNCFIFGLGTV